MNKKVIWIIVVGIIYAIFLGIIILSIIFLKWSWWVLFWIVIISIVFYVSFIVIRYIISQQSKKKVEKQEPTITIEQQQAYVRKYVRHDDYLAGELNQIEIKPYTPKQEGIDKLTVDIARCVPYWLDIILFLALSRNKFEVIAYKEYEFNDMEAEKKFELEVDKAVLNPERSIEIADVGIDPETLQPKTVKRKVPLSYIQQERAKRLQEQEEQNVGVEKE